MTGLLGHGGEAKKENTFASFRYQTSQKGSALPLVYGANRIAPNLLDYQNFTTSKSGGKKGGGGKGGIAGGGGGKGGGSQSNYQVDFVAGLCQGPVAGFGEVWYNKTITTFLNQATGLSFAAVGDDGQATDSYWTANYPLNAISYSGTAFFTGDQYQLGPSPAMPNFNVEIYGMEFGTAPNGDDANPANIVTDLLTNPRYGAEFPTANLDSSGTIADYRNYCNAAGLMLAPVYDAQQPASQMLAELAAITNSAIVWSGGLLKIIPYGDQPLSATYTWLQFFGPTTAGDQIFLTIDGAFPGAPVTLGPHYLSDSDAVSYSAAGASLCALITGNGSIEDPGNGALAAAGIYATATTFGLAIVSTQGVDPVVSATVDSAGGLNISVGVVGSPNAWTPNTTPIYSLADDDFIVQESSVGTYIGVTPGGAALRAGAGPITGGFTDDPVHISRSSPADALNMVQLEITDRGTSYNTSVVEAFDQGAIDLYGVRRDTSVKARAIVDPYFVATVAAQLVLQRQLLYRNTYTFRLGWRYILLEPMDLVQITDPRLGAQALTVRITSIEEDEEGALSVTAEDWFGSPETVLYPPSMAGTAFAGVSSLGSGAGTASPYPKQGGSSQANTPNNGKAAPSVNTPFILEPTAELLRALGQTSPYVAIGLSGGPNGSFSSNWGGADVYASLDGSTYTKFGSQSGSSTMGYTTADCGPAGTSLSVDLSESDGQLASVSPQMAAAGTSLCAVRTPGGLLEFLSYTTAILTGTDQYTLTGLYRGLYGTAAIDLPAGSQFLALGSGSVFVEVLPTQFVGQTIHFEFPSFNSVGGGMQNLADTVAYTYVPQGSSVVPGIFPQLVTGRAPLSAEIGQHALNDFPIPLESR